MRRYICMLLLASLVLGMFSGCASGKDVQKTPEPVLGEAQVPETTLEPEVPATIPPKGDPYDVTCKGSYSGEGEPDVVAATVGGTELTNEALRVWYWAEVAAWRQGDYEVKPDFDRPLDTQVCPIDYSVNSWQQYFLKRALNNWHGVQALTQQAKKEGLPLEEAYQPIQENLDKYMTGMPATKFLYGYDQTYSPNTMHQSWLDTIADTLETVAQEKGYATAFEMAESAFGTTREELESQVYQYNWSYTYFTNLGYEADPTKKEIKNYYKENADSYEAAGTLVSIRHLLLIPENGDWAKARTRAEELLKSWSKGRTVSEATFAELCRANSQDPGTTVNGGSYYRIRQGQLTKVLDEWCFDETRQPGETAVLESDQGVHVVYFCQSEEAARVQAQLDLTAQRQQEIVSAAREAYPMRVMYSVIALGEGDGQVSYGDLLYPDVAHERFPEVPLYLQQNYQTTNFAENYPIRTYGCGITTFAMLASYMADDELTPPEMCEAYSKYGSKTGTDGMLFIREPSGLGFYLKEKIYNPTQAHEALKQGYIVVTLQHQGHWTRGGHYLLLEKALDDERIQVRDSNIFNYERVKDHAIDSHKWSTIPNAADGFWIFEKKVTAIPACGRCGQSDPITEALVQEEYTCEKCEKALVRRNAFLTVCG